uniref:Uncharacterized protein n=2 Tax=viral metagenome TaxID=1070528 RepID=A0A6H1ZYN3_9ZZZZ
MALTQGAWSVTTVNKLMVATCSVVQTIAENDAYTLKTPKELDPTKPWMLVVSTSAATDAVAVPLDIWCGFADTFVLAGDGATVAATAGVNFKQLTDDIGFSAATVSCFILDPELPVADVVTIAAIASGYKAKIPVAPYYAFNLDGASTLLAATVTYYIIQ